MTAFFPSISSFYPERPGSNGGGQSMPQAGIMWCILMSSPSDLNEQSLQASLFDVKDFDL